MPTAGEAKVVKLTGSIVSKKEGCLASSAPRTALAMSPPNEYPTMLNRVTACSGFASSMNSSIS